MTEQLKNSLDNPTSTLASGITSGDLSLTVASGHGDRFPATGDFRVKLTDQADPTLYELVICTSRSTDTLTITRAAEGTTARAFVTGDLVDLVLTTAGLAAYYAESSSWLPRQYKTGWYYQTNQAASGDSTVAPVQDRVIFHAFPVGEALTIDRITCGVSTSGSAGSVVRLGIYASTDGLPSTLVLDAGTVAGDGVAGYREITVSQALAAGTLYWIAVVWQVAAPGVLRASAVGAGSDWVGHSSNAVDPRTCSYLQSGVTGALPNPATPASGGTTTAAVKVRAV